MRDYRTLDMTVISTNNLQKWATLFGKSDVYAVVYIYGSSDTIQKLKTPVHKSGGSNPTWNFPMKFIVDYAAILKKRVGFTVKIKAVGICRDKKLGEIRWHFAVVTTALNDMTSEGEWTREGEVTSISVKSEGCFNVTYRLGGQFSSNAEKKKIGKGAGAGFVGGGLFGLVMAGCADCCCGCGGGGGYIPTGHESGGCGDGGGCGGS